MVQGEILLTVFLASVAGSLHCAGMCGPLMLCACADTPGRREGGSVELGRGFGARARWRAALRAAWSPLAYHAGRGVGYVSLGLAAGLLGALLNLGTSLAGFQPIAAVLAGAALIVVALAAIAQAFSSTKRSGPSRLAERFAWLTAGPKWLLGRATRVPASLRGATVGLATTLLPCGWLYAFVIAAAGTGSAISGGLLMAVFWLGTLPVMLGLGLGAATLARWIGQRVPRLTAWTTAVAALIVGGLMLTGRLGLDTVALAQHAETSAIATDGSPLTTADDAHCGMPTASDEADPR